MARLSYAIGMATIVWPAMAYAAVGGGTLPWDATLTTLQTDLQGALSRPVAGTTRGTLGVLSGGFESISTEYLESKRDRTDRSDQNKRPAHGPPLAFGKAVR